MKTTPLKILTVITATALLFSACGGAGGGADTVGESAFSTQTGNPPEGDEFMDPQANPSISEQFHVTLGGLAESICVKITDGCFNGYMSYGQCERELGRRQDLATFLGFEDGEYANFADMLSAEESGLITVANEPMTDCIYSMTDLECDDPRIQAGFDIEHRKLADIRGMLSANTAACAAVSAASAAAVEPDLQ